MIQRVKDFLLEIDNNGRSAKEVLQAMTRTELEITCCVMTGLTNKSLSEETPITPDIFASFVKIGSILKATGNPKVAELILEWFRKFSREQDLEHLNETYPTVN